MVGRIEGLWCGHLTNQDDQIFIDVTLIHSARCAYHVYAYTLMMNATTRRWNPKEFAIMRRVKFPAERIYIIGAFSMCDTESDIFESRPIGGKKDLTSADDDAGISRRG